MYSPTLNVFTDPLLGYFRDRFLFGQPVEVAAVLVKVTGGVTLVNSLLSTACATVLYLALEPALTRAHLLPGSRSAAHGSHGAL